MMTIDQIEYIKLNALLQYRSRYKLPTASECIEYLQKEIERTFKPANIKLIQERRATR